MLPAAVLTYSGGRLSLLSDLEVASTKTQAPAGPLSRGGTLGQTFVARHDGLTKIEVMVATYAASLPSGELILHLSHYPGQQKDIASRTVPASSIKDDSYVALELASQFATLAVSPFIFIWKRVIFHQSTPLPFG